MYVQYMYVVKMQLVLYQSMLHMRQAVFALMIGPAILMKNVYNVLATKIDIS